MRIIGGRRATYLYLSGLKVGRPVPLAPGIALLPACLTCSDRTLRAITQGPVDYHIASLLAPSIGSQIKVSGPGSREVAARSWNATWDALLIGALFDIELFPLLNSTTDASKVTSKSKVYVTHYHVPRYVFSPGTELDDGCLNLLEKRFPSAQRLMQADRRFQDAVHCLATYRWHTLPRAQLALIWSGIEGLFGVESEVTFRVSLYSARFLAPDDPAQRREIFKMVKRLYVQRSKAVHGSELRDEPENAVHDSSRLLRSLVMQCITDERLPVLGELAP